MIIKAIYSLILLIAKVGLFYTIIGTSLPIANTIIGASLPIAYTIIGASLFYSYINKYYTVLLCGL